MIAERLRKAVLQAAIQGKLTEQRPEDGDARELLAQIEAEREWLVKEGKIKKQKPLPEITEDEIPFEIPESWCWVRMGEVFHLQAGRFVSASEIFQEPADGLFPCFGGNGQRGYVNRYNREGHYPLIGRQGALCGNINLASGKFYATEHAVAVDVFAGCSSFWAASFLKALNLNQYATSTAQPGIAVSTISKVLLPLPTLAEQQRIVAKLGEVLPQIDKLQAEEEALAKLQEEFPQKLKNSLLQAAIQGKLTERLPEDGDARELLVEVAAGRERLVKEGKMKRQKPLPEITEDEIPFEIPENWCWVRLGEVAVLNPRNRIDDDKEVSFIPMALIHDGYGNKHSCERKLWGQVKSGYTHFAEGDIVVAKITPCFQNRKSAIMRGLVNGYGAGTTELHVIRPLIGRLSNEYLLYLFKTECFIHNGCLVMTGTAGQQRVGRDYFENLLIPLPTFAEQQRIVAKLEELLPLCDALAVY